MTTRKAAKDLQKIRLALLRGKTWQYLRYLHFREAFKRIATEVRTVCICGAGHGLAELAVAIEFPEVEFILTDIIAKGYPNYHRAMDFCWKWGIENVSFGIWNVLEPTHRTFDLVCSTEMLEHIDDAPRAALNMRRAASKYVYCLVPFADDATNADLAKRQRAWERHGHYVFGYDGKRLETLFPGRVMMAGAYWTNAGQRFRAKLQGMSDDQIAAS